MISLSTVVDLENKLGKNFVKSIIGIDVIDQARDNKSAIQTLPLHKVTTKREDICSEVGIVRKSNIK